ncbi:aminotransferase [Raphidocelis subcapitata]|uniref:Aminotransferase n=1 Tax=Raphidocelis subcapitata TaxID=307507 RepID=A0A2V0PBC4_9CHLO|nr:aminotransferase [Raphidocelis subcapitata]|eukprot:GBF97164.1 aminotransferase [Raphidocelis subcapitata]
MGTSGALAAAGGGGPSAGGDAGVAAGGAAAAGAAAAAPAKPLNAAFSTWPTTVFEVMSKLAAAHQSVNLGQGFPDEEGPAAMKAAAAAALTAHHNQYPPMMGVPELRQAVARHSAREQGIPCDWATETLVTVGATEGIAAAFMGLCNPGDEVIVFEPLYDSYVGMCAQVGAKLVAVQLQPPEWSIPEQQLEAAFSERTKFILVNTPHNPTGKVFSRAELELIARLAERHGAYVLSDEVYEHLTFPGAAPHVSIRSLPRMRERTIRLGSAGKTFSLTAWKIGWMEGPERLLAPCVKAHQFLVFTVPSSLQRAVAEGLDGEEGRAFYSSLGAECARQRALLRPRLEAIGFRVLPARGTYFLVADAAPFLRPGEDDVAFAKRLTAEGGVTVIPVSAFYADAARAPASLVRFCYCKEDAKLAAACERLEAYLGGGKAGGGGAGAAAGAGARAAAAAAAGPA